MTLRTRIACAAGLAVALAVIAAAVAVYLGVRGELRGEVDDSLRARAPIHPRSRPRRARASRGTRAVRPARRRGGPRTSSRGTAAAFGGAEGYVQLVFHGGRVLRRPGATGQLPVQARA